MSISENPTIEELLALISALHAENVALRAEVDLLRKGGPKPPSLTDLPHFVKPNRPKRELKEKRQRRQRDCGFSRPSAAEYSRVETHAVGRCPDCGRALTGGWVHAEREVIDIPEVVVEVVRHQLIARRCGVCRKRCLPSAREVFSSKAVGRHRFGVRLMGLVAHLSGECRLPVRTVRRLLFSLFGVRISDGGIVALLKAVAKVGDPLYEALKEQVRGSPFVHADETGWREDGVNGYLWSVSTPDVRWFHRDQSRGHQVPETILGSDYKGVVVSDFYGGYNYHLGPHQRCWVHLLRDIKKLCEAFPDDKQLHRWAKRVHNLYEKSKAVLLTRPSDRVQARERFQRMAVAIASPYAGKKNADTPQAALAQRILNFEPELFTFVEHPEVPPNNNAAERAIRPAVIARKVCGGTRSLQGSTTKAVLMTLFGTWHLRGEDTLDACKRMLAQAT